METLTPASSSHSRVFRVLPILAVLCIAFSLRLWALGQNPPGLFRDEARKAYATYSLIETGRDLTGRVWPLQVKEFSAYTTPFYHWFSIPFITSMGVTLTSTRLLAALAGSLACLFVFLLGRDWASRSVGIWAGLILAVSPWHLLFSRWANQGILMTLFIPAAVWMTWKALEGRERILEQAQGTRQDPRSGGNSLAGESPLSSMGKEEAPSGVAIPFAWGWTLGASLCWALAWNAYEPARLFVPLFLFALIGIEAYRAGVKKDSCSSESENANDNSLARESVPAPVEASGRMVWKLFVIGVLTVVWISPFVVDIVWKWNETQARLTAITGDQPFNPTAFVGNYLLHWNPVYLLWSGDANPRHHISGQGQLSGLECLAFITGLIFLFKVKTPWRSWLVAWLLLAPVPAAITHEGLPHALRTLMIVPAIALVAGYGLSQLLDRFPCPFRIIAPSLLVLLVLIQTGYTWYHFMGPYREKAALYWEAGFVEALRTVEANRKEGEICVVSGLIEFPQATVEFVTLPDPRSIQTGVALPGYRFIPTGQPLNPLEFKDARLFLTRPNEIRTPPWWREIRPDKNNEAMRMSWQLFRSSK